ncbi:hypothetical protein R1sor_012774 [Riccia sorocarpa]|uniref:Amidohydrolase-related domain-containing protein n=1 Tax=Riccia sorocarpa TaxID=122646 RepID=A0ABD3I4T1_9MARC
MGERTLTRISRGAIQGGLLVVALTYLLVPFSANASTQGDREQKIYGAGGLPPFSIPPGTKRIDTHCHFIPPFYLDILRAKGLDSGGRAIPKWTPEEHIELLDTLGVETAVVSISTPGVHLPGFDRDDARKLARDLNEYGHKISVEYPGRFLFFATLTLPDVEGAVAEAIYALDTLKAAGVILFANHEGEYLGSKKFDPLMAVLNEREAVVFVHPNKVPLAPVPDTVEDSGVPEFLIDFLLDTTRAASNLILKDVTGRYPNIKFILSHSGGFMPFAAYRIGGALSFLTKAPMPKVLGALQSFYVDTALSSSPSALPSTVAFVPHNHITFGSDFPFAPTFGIKIATSQLDGYQGLETEKKTWVNYDNASDLLKKPLAHWRTTWEAPAASPETQHEEL